MFKFITGLFNKSKPKQIVINETRYPIYALLVTERRIPKLIPLNESEFTIKTISTKIFSYLFACGDECPENILISSMNFCSVSYHIKNYPFVYATSKDRDIANKQWKSSKGNIRFPIFLNLVQYYCSLDKKVIQKVIEYELLTDDELIDRIKILIM
jgi:Mn2+/Fe2+ NRAMP family transporter